MFVSVLPALAGVLAGVSLLPAAVTPEMLRDVLGGGPVPFVVALLVGGVALMPGFVAYPPAGVMHANGASNPVPAAFITTLMLVGVVTLPIEARFLPATGLLVGLFDVWVPRSTIERHLGRGAGAAGVCWVVLPATLQAGPS